MNYDYRTDYRRNLPHYQPRGAILFVTFRLAGSVPIAVLQQLKAEAEAREERIRLGGDGPEQQRLLYEERKRQFGRWDDVLDAAREGPHWLGEPRIATIVYEALRYRDGRVYDLDVFCIMPTHVHAIFAPLPREDGTYHPLQTILHSLKRHTARHANDALGRNGAFWQHESYDHVVRNPDEWGRIVNYVLHNPVKAGLAETWEAWPWTYARWRDALRDLPNRGSGEA
jgi:REP element-mobilizing transposase RayT